MSDSDRPADTRSSHRYRVELPVELGGQERAGSAATRDISSSGVFILTDHPFEKDSALQFSLTLQGPDFPEPGVRVECKANVVRVESLDGQRLGIAATIKVYRFVPPAKPSS